MSYPQKAADSRRTDCCRERPAIFDDLYRQYYQSIWVFAARITGSRAEAADIAQETFVRLHRCLAAGDDIRQPRPWLYRVAANLSRNHVRRVRYFERVICRRFTEPESEMSAEDALVREDELTRLRTAVAGLSERDRLFVMCYQDELTYAEMAVVTGVKVQSVGKLLSRAIDRLARVMNRESES